MASTVEVNGEKFPKKRTYYIGVKSRRCGYSRHKEFFLFAGGLIAILLSDGSVLIFSTHHSSTPLVEVCFCEAQKDSAAKICFLDPEWNAAWRQIFVYLFDEDGSFLLYADRNHLEDIGVRFSSVGEDGSARIRKEACNVAAIWGSDLLDEIQKIEYQPYDEEDFSANLISNGGLSSNV